MSKGKEIRARVGVEALEDRRLLSVSVTPHRLNIKTLEHGNGKFTVRVLSDTQAATDVLNSGGDWKFSVLDSDGNAIDLGTSNKVNAHDRNHDGVADLQLKFNRSVLKGLAAGEYTIQVSSSDGTLTDSGTLSIFNPHDQIVTI